ncbi:glycoside hydrolase family 43 protein [Paenibacillus piri]|uniref:Glycosyl hydrolase 43 family protein n=1 Tax=Paenibacillus piri TaxID=2547395 RepID=A0A4R5KJT2_9BACL|nr:glycoside hydrolase 43 family protein [Paenibacillus piri]TDF95781.1 glycosyl hydrolase 43 family protein [Paenibacillus piri]
MSKADIRAAQSHSVWTPDLGDGTFKNPIVHADYSDPDVIRVGEDFYMTASSFSHVPGLPILHSNDLVNWTIIGYAVDRLDLPGYDLPQHGKGIWAPSLRYHEGKFWIFFGAPDEGIFMTTAVDPRGPWTPLHCVKEAKGWIDTCPLWDDDGQAYLVHAFAHSRSGIKHKLQVCKMSPDGTRLLDDGVIVFDGTENHPTLEGPKIYKRNGYYYIFAPAGGVPTGWQLILRSRSIYGPFQEKIVLHQGDSVVNGPHQGGWVELESGESWFIHFQDKDAYGRVAHLQPVRWMDDWPLMGADTNGDGIGEPVLRTGKPKVGREWPAAVPDTTDHFAGERLGLQWQWQANPQNNWYSLKDKPGHLRLFAKPLPDGVNVMYDAPQLLMQKFPAEVFTVTAKMELHAEHAGEQAGLIVFGYTYGSLSLRQTGNGLRVELLYGEAGNDGVSERVEASEDVPDGAGPVYLRAAVGEMALCQFSYSLDGEQFRKIGSSFYASKGRWVGAKAGLYAVGGRAASHFGTVPDSGSSQSSGYADFDWIAFD